MFVRVISGPTGSGKSQIAESLRRDLGDPYRLVNADAFQCYREIRILSNRESTDERNFFGFRSLSEAALTAGDYARLAEERLTDTSIFVGCGLYLHATLFGLDADRRKGTPFQKEPRKPFRMIVLSPKREELYERLNHRVDQMIASGAMSEAEKILQMIHDRKILSDHSALKAIGLQHLLKHLQGEWTLEFAIEMWKRDTRRLAKRQWTWLRKFAAPSATIRWLEEPNVAKIKAFWDES